MVSTLDPDTERRLERFLGDWLADANVPGASIAVLRDDEPVYASGFGSRDLDENAPATPDTLYGVASCTKSFTGLAILLLEERGALALDDPVTEHVDAFAVEGADGPITLHDLLTHSSGLPSLGSSVVLLNRLTGIEEHAVPLGDREDFYRHLNGAGDEVTGADRFMYCNEGYNVLGDVVEAVSGDPFHEFVEREILAPLGMERSTFDPTTLDDGDAMTPHALRDGEPEATPFPHRPVSYPAGGLIAPVTELTNYLRLQTNGGTFEGTDLVAADTLERAHAGHVERADSEYGYGWQRETVGDRTLVGHGGSLGVASSYVGFTADGEYAIAMAANATPSPTPPTVAKGVLAILDGDEPADRVPYYARDERFTELTGEYESYRGIVTATVERRGAALELTVDHPLGSERQTLLPTDPESPGLAFEVPTMTGATETATFERTDDGVDLFVGRNRFHRRR